LTCKTRVNRWLLFGSAISCERGGTAIIAAPGFLRPVYRRDEDHLLHPGVRVQIYAGRKDDLDAPVVAGINYKFCHAIGRAQNWRMAGPTPDIFCAAARNFSYPRRVIAWRVLQKWGCSVEPQRILPSFPDAETRPHLLTLAVTRKKFGAMIHGLEPALRHGGCHE
jgi:hypothetical protein